MMYKLHKDIYMVHIWQQIIQYWIYYVYSNVDMKSIYAVIYQHICQVVLSDRDISVYWFRCHTRNVVFSEWTEFYFGNLDCFMQQSFAWLNLMQNSGAWLKRSHLFSILFYEYVIDKVCLNANESSAGFY